MDGAPRNPTLAAKTNAWREWAPDQSGTAFRVSAQFVMQPIRDFYYSSSTFRALSVY
jgi:hypothetical protein